MTAKTITPFITASYLEQATSNIEGGVAIQCASIQVGQGKQEIQTDDYGRAITDKLAAPLGYVDIRSAKKITPYQWQLTVNLKDIDIEEWAFREFAVCDQNKRVISIFGSKEIAIIWLTPFLNNALLTINFAVGVLPANSIEIIHKNQPLELLNVANLLAMDIAIGRLTLANMLSYNKRQEDELKAQKKREQHEVNTQKMLDKQMVVLQRFKEKIAVKNHRQQLFNITTEQSIGQLSLTKMKSIGE